MSETITAADGTEINKVEACMNECKRLGSSDNPTIRFTNTDGRGLDIEVTETPLLKVEADRIVADELDVDTDKIADLIQHRLDGRKVGNYRVGSIEVHPEHGVVVDADIVADVKDSDSRESLESDIVSIAN